MPGTVIRSRQWIHSDLLPHRLFENGDLLAQLPPGRETRPNDQADFGRALEERFALLLTLGISGYDVSPL
jgi:hypothetical protein